MSEPKILLFDIESSHLKAPFAIIFCICWKHYGKSKVHTIRVGRDKQGFLCDDNVFAEFADVWDSSDYAVAHYGQRFDWRMINTKTAKLIKQGKMKARLSPIKLLDTWRVSRDNFAMHSNRLQSLSEYFETKTSKTPLTPQIWQRASQGCEKSIRYIIKHCVHDVGVLEEYFEVARPWFKEPPRYLFTDGPKDNCIQCGSVKLHHRGSAVTERYRYPRLQCQSCGRWQRGKFHEHSNKPLELVG